MKIIKVTDDFWNIRGSFKIGGLLDIGTHASLVRLQSGKFLFLDSLTLSDDILAEVQAITDNGNAIEAVLNLHPFHTVHVKWMHETFPNAKHYGTARHLKKFPDLAWQSELLEEHSTQAQFTADLAFSVPRGVDFISANPNLHFSSILALHKPSKTIHVDDTLMYTKLPKPIGETVSFHLTLAKTLEKRAGAAADFQAWAAELINDWGDAENLCTAHTHALLAAKNNGASIKDRIQAALTKVEKKLEKHQKQYG